MICLYAKPFLKEGHLCLPPDELELLEHNKKKCSDCPYCIIEETPQMYKMVGDEILLDRMVVPNLPEIQLRFPTCKDQSFAGNIQSDDHFLSQLTQFQEATQDLKSQLQNKESALFKVLSKMLNRMMKYLNFDRMGKVFQYSTFAQNIAAIAVHNGTIHSFSMGGGSAGAIPSITANMFPKAISEWTIHQQMLARVMIFYESLSFWHPFLLCPHCYSQNEIIKVSERHKVCPNCEKDLKGNKKLMFAPREEPDNPAYFITPDIYYVPSLVRYYTEDIREKLRLTRERKNLRARR